MTKRQIQLESFETGSTPVEEIALAPSDFEDARLAAFEKGYSAGWDDAVQAQDVEAARFRSDLGQNLQELSFTYHEARQHLLEALRPLLIDMAAKVLPAIARQTLGQIVAEQLTPLAEALTSAPITIVANPDSLPQIREVLADRASLPLVFAEEASLGEGQVYLKFAETETRIDLDGVITLITEAINTYFRANQQEQEHG